MRLHCTCGVLREPFLFPGSLHPTVPLPNYIINNPKDNRLLMHYTNAVEQTEADWVASLQKYLYPAATCHCHCPLRAQSECALTSLLQHVGGPQERLSFRFPDPTSQLTDTSRRLLVPETVVQSPNAAGESANLSVVQAQTRDDIA